MKEPKTELPWNLKDLTDKQERELVFKSDIIRASIEGKNNILIDIGFKQDFEYIVEACNNYPKAIELIEYFVKKVDDGKAKSFETYNLYKDFLNSLK